MFHRFRETKFHLRDDGQQATFKEVWRMTKSFGALGES
jgi:hypothetical protein